MQVIAVEMANALIQFVFVLEDTLTPLALGSAQVLSTSYVLLTLLGGATNPCSGHGTCSDGASGTGTCTCYQGWATCGSANPCEVNTNSVSPIS